MKQWLVATMTFCLLMFGTVSGAQAKTRPVPDLVRALQILKAHRTVDLAHLFEPGIPHYVGFPDEVVKQITTVEKDGFAAQTFTVVGQWGTHIDAPAHFFAHGQTVDQIAPAQMILPMVVLDVHDKVRADPDYVVSMQDVANWEKRHGRIPHGAFVALRTDWAARWPDAAAMLNKSADGVPHYPGWSRPVLEYLIKGRGAVAIGHEPGDTDPGLNASKGDYSLERFVLEQGRFQIEYMAGLDQVPESGAIVIVAFPKAKDATGFPARVLAVVP